MPKSAVRKKNGRPVRRRPIRAAAPADRFNLPAIPQSEVARLIDDLERLLMAVPGGYNPTDIRAVMEHHHRASELVSFMRNERVVETLAMLAGGDLVVQADVEPEPDPLDGMTDRAANAIADLFIGDAEMRGIPLPRRIPERLPGEVPLPLDEPSDEMIQRVLDGLHNPAPSERTAEGAYRRLYGPNVTVGGVQESVSQTVHSYDHAGVIAATDERERVRQEMWEAGNRCPVCDRVISRDLLSRYRVHGKRVSPCPGSGGTFDGLRALAAETPSGPVRTVVR